MKKSIAFHLLGFIAALSYAQEQNMYESLINRDVDSCIEGYKTTDSNTLLLDLNNERSNLIRLNKLFTQTASQTTDPDDVLPIINKMYWASIRYMALSTALYNNGGVKEEVFVAGMRLMKDGLMLVLQGTEDMGLDIDSMINYRTLLETPVEFWEAPYNQDVMAGKIKLISL
ncbi:MAG: hypothetical protein LBH85_04965 [Treponema sp.]|jgi:hypothetical protein|nr:hypothetical protein [Treponema sp.]